MQLDQVISSWVEKTPDKVAVEDENHQLSYGCLDLESHYVASHLLVDDRSINRPVAIYLPKSCAYVSAIFGILKSGAFYIPLDYKAPVTRNKQILQKYEIKKIITDQKGINHFSGLKDLSVLSIDKLRQRPYVLKTKQIGKLAYALFTSGSSGVPKGALFSHEAALAFVERARHKILPNYQDVFCSHAPFHFDLSIFDLFVSLSVGAKLCLLPERFKLFPKNIDQYLRKMGISIWYSVPSAFYHLSEFTSIKNLRKVILAGEVLTSKLCLYLKKYFPHAQLYNFYGPTETNVCLSYEVTQLNVDEVPIGLPWEGVELKKEQLELLVSTPTLMQGYWNAEESNHKKMSIIDSKVFYHTGDMVTQNEKGLYLFKGRIDRQVKVRGYRIELEEIETVILSISECIDAVCVLKKDALVAYVSGHGEHLISRVSKIITQKLPIYMLPSEIIVLDQIPRTARDKIDYTLLQNLT